jgi:DnaJ homolog subfamily C member 8
MADTTNTNSATTPLPQVDDDEDNTTEDDWKIQTQEQKSLGDTAFRSGDYDAAIHHYTAALSLDPDNAVLLSNRSAAYLISGQKSAAFHDAVACNKNAAAVGTLGLKGISRLAAALQALGRLGPALQEWERILKEDCKHAAALKGKEFCLTALEKQKQAEQKEEPKQSKESEPTTTTNTREGNDSDDLDDFFNDVEDAATQVTKVKDAVVEPQSTDAIKQHSKTVGTAADQVARLLAERHEWRNLNPYYVLDLPHTASTENVSRRYKALSLLLHPDKNRNCADVPVEKVQEAYDHVQKAKVILDDEDKARHAQQLIQAGMKQGKDEWEKKRSPSESLDILQAKAVQRIFAEVEMKRRQVEERERKYEQREQQQEEEELQKERKSRDFDKQWTQETRVDKRIGNWRDFQKKKHGKL